MKKILFITSFLFIVHFLTAQTGNVGIGTNSPDPSAALDITSADKGILIPRTTKLDVQIATGTTTIPIGLLIFDTDDNKFFFWNGTEWENMSGSSTFETVNGVVRNTGNHATEDFVFGSSSLPQNDVEVTDNLLFFDKDKAAFRVGRLDQSANWATDSLGLYSFASGDNTKAMGEGSTAMGIATIATGPYSTSTGLFTKATGVSSTSMGYVTEAIGDASTSLGYETKAVGENSTAMGYQTEAIGSASIATGSLTKASGANSIAMGEFSEASGFNSIALGREVKATNVSSIAMGAGTHATGGNSTAMGIGTKARGDFSTAMGYVTNASAYGETALGRYNTIDMDADSTTWIETDRLFTIGNGDFFNSSDAMIVYKNGDVVFGSDNLPQNGVSVTDNIFFFDKDKAAFRVGGLNQSANWATDSLGINSFASGVNTKAIGEQSTAMGAFTKATGSYSTAMGENTQAMGENSTAIGSDTQATGSYSTAMGENTQAIAYASTAMGVGTIASGENSTAMGSATQATGENSTAMGVGTIATGNHSTAMGFQTQATGENSTAMGSATQATGYASTAMGDNTIATGSRSTALGENTQATAYASTAMGENTLATGQNSTTMGWGTKASAQGETAIGLFNTVDPNANAYSWEATDRLFTVGNGEAGSLSDAMIVYKNGNTEINGEVNINDNYTLPTAAGVAGQAIINDGTAELKWGSPSANELIDADGDTKITLGEGLTQDSINFKMSTGSATATSRISMFNYNNQPKIDITSSSRSIAIGKSALAVGGPDQKDNVAIGQDALSKLNGDNNNGNGGPIYDADENVAVGNGALKNSILGENNVALGYETLSSNVIGKYNVAIGHNAGKNELGGSKLYIESSDADSTEALIYGEFNNDFLRLNGEVTVKNQLNVLDSLTVENHTTLNDDLTVQATTTLNNQLYSNHGGIFGGVQGSNPAGVKGTRVFYDNVNDHGSVLAYNYSNGQVKDLVLQKSGGNVGVGMVPITNRLEVSGDASKSSAGNWLANSDSRLKKNIIDISADQALNNLLKLQGVTYEWNDDKTGNARPEGIQYGFTAQNIAEVFPSLVTEDALGYLQTAYGTYDAMTIEAIRALHNKNKQQEERIAKLENEKQEQSARMAKMEAALETIISSTASLTKVED